MRTITGANLIAGSPSSLGGHSFTGFDPRTGRPHETCFTEANQDEVDPAVRAAYEAAEELRRIPLASFANLLVTVAAAVEAVTDRLVEVADGETALGSERLRSECGRACDQFRRFARVLERGDHLEAVIDLPDAGGTSPQSDLRRMQVPVGPVAVFAASNFPLAFSVLGADVASALAAGCPVIVKAHPSHPGTSELSAWAVIDALQQCGLPAAMFSLLQGQTQGLGEMLVTAPAIKAVGFTGSLLGGRTLYDLAGRRPIPIPVYAEMGSLNPVFVTSGTLEHRLDEFARDFVASMTLGNGQFCTKPGLLIAPADNWELLLARLKSFLELSRPGPMLSERVSQNVMTQVSRTLNIPQVDVLARIPPSCSAGYAADLVLATTNDRTFREWPALLEEHFGPFALVVRHESSESMLRSAEALSGSLTATIHCQPDEIESVAPLARLLWQKAGRLIWNGFPTGVAVTDAMEHGGPYPATTFAEHTSVGSFAIRRWLRPVCFQSYPDALLPPALQVANPLHLRRLVNGEWTTDSA